MPNEINAATAVTARKPMDNPDTQEAAKTAKTTDSEAVGCRDLVLPVPKALYPCKYCYEDYSWPPDDLHWSAKVEGWVCSNCWEEEDQTR